MQKTTKTGEALKDIIATSERVGDMVSQIAIAATQQRTATEQISHNISDISATSQAALTNANHTAEACTHLSELAANLQKLVTEFQIIEGRRNGTGRVAGTPSIRRGAVQALRTA